MIMIIRSHISRRFGTVLCSRAVSSQLNDSASKDLEMLSNDGPFPWTKVEGRDAISKTYNFTDFSQAWKFMSKVAVLAEDMDHHPVRDSAGDDCTSVLATQLTLS